MPELTAALSYIPTILLWLLVLFLLISEGIGKFATNARPRFRRYAALLVIMLVTWWVAQTASNVDLTIPDLQPWKHFMADTPTTPTTTPAPSAKPSTPAPAPVTPPRMNASPNPTPTPEPAPK